MDICRICLAIDIKVYKLGNNEAKYFIENIFMQNGYNQELHENQHICFECKALLDKSYKFIKRVLKAQEILYDMLKEKKAITPESLKKIDRRATGYILVKDFKNIDLFIGEEDNINIKNNILKNYQCEVKINNAVDQTDNPEKDVNTFDTFHNDNLDTSSELDVKDFIDKISTEEKLEVSFDNFEDAITCELDETTLADEVKDEILEENINKKVKKKQVNKASINSIGESKILEFRILNKKPKKKHLNKKNKQYKYSMHSIEKNEELFEYNGTEDLNGPRQLMAPDYPVKCEHCSYEVPNRLAHFRHYQWEHQDKKYPYGKKTGKIFICKFCGHTSYKKYRHVEHEQTHGDVHNFTCPQCPKTFVNRVRLHSHIYRTHPAQMLECDYCGKKVKSRASIMIHLRIHTGERPFKCPICGAGFAHRGNIRPHIRSNHDG